MKAPILLLFTLCLAISGCTTTDSGRVYPGSESLIRTGLEKQFVELKGDVTFVAKPNWGRQRTYKLPQGRYALHGKDSQGRFFKHVTSGFYFDGDGPIPGGFFVPHDGSKPMGLWSTGASKSQAFALLGAAGTAVAANDPESQAIYIVDLPTSTADFLRPLTKN